VLKRVVTEAGFIKGDITCHFERGFRNKLEIVKYAGCILVMFGKVMSLVLWGAAEPNPYSLT
jgi:hypothetical protein